MLEAGEIEGIPTAGAGEANWRIPIHGDVSVPPPPVTAVPTEAPAGHSEARDLPDEPGEPGLPPAVTEEPRQLTEVSRGEDAAAESEPTSASGRSEEHTSELQ